MKSNIITLKKGEVLAIGIANQKGGKEKLLQTYFENIFSIAMELGFSEVAQLQIDEVSKGDFLPNNNIGFFSWPNFQALESFLKIMPQTKLTILRKPIWNELKQYVISLPEDKNITLETNKTYEVKIVWDKLQFDEVNYNEDIEKKQGRVVLNYPISAYEDLLSNDQTPSRVLLIEWVSKSDALNFNKNHNNNFRKEEAFYTHFELEN